MKSWIEISRSRLAANYQTLSRSAGAETSVLAVIKADAYGHDAALCAPVLAGAGAQWLGVTDPEEGALVRHALSQGGLAIDEQPHILVMSGSLPEEAHAIVAHRLTAVAWSIDELNALHHAAQQAGVRLPVHIEIDTGMSRQGAAPGAAFHEILQWFAAQNVLTLDGVMTHFASAEIAGSRQTAAQQRSFEAAIAQLNTAGITPAWIHAGNTSAIDNLYATEDAATSLEWLVNVAGSIGARAMVRSGLALYGFCLPIELDPGSSRAPQSFLTAHLKPVLTWKARVIGIREIAPGAHVGYGGTFTATQPMRLALLPVGYADGLRRDLSSTTHTSGWVMFQGQRAPIVGRVSMNLTVADVTGIPSVQLGDEAMVLGEGTTAEDHACLAHTIPYEILCGMKAPRQLVP